MSQPRFVKTPPRRRTQLPIALTIAGSDSGGGAGIQADLKTFAALGVHGASAITCVTAQNPKRVTAIQAIRPTVVLRQIEAVFDELRPAAVKTGMLYSADIIRVVAEFFAEGKKPPLVVDPVMVATSGATLLQPKAIRVLRENLLPLAALITPNLDEAALLTGHKLCRLCDLEDAARLLHGEFGCAVLVKGGHLRDAARATDVFFDGREARMLTARWVQGVSTHGTGCTFSAAITALLARGNSMPRAVQMAKQCVTRAIARSYRAGRHFALSPQRTD